ncbi:hypothetical protein EII17_12800 [Clostridiales bacterium COT073_COT-073]|nr:hypothetical protein EII17_12800 [Clostridiales bacterium COT073_COT-073]
MTQSDFEYLMKLEKYITEIEKIGKTGTISAFSRQTDDIFLIDTDRTSKIELSKFKIQSRYERTKRPLIRIDIDSPPHLNPDGTKTSRNHIHIFKEEFDDFPNLPWAYDLSQFFSASEYDFTSVWEWFCNYSNIKVDFQGELAI